jgi:hypothetical protein
MHVVGDQVCDTYTVHDSETGTKVHEFTINCTPILEDYNHQLRAALEGYPGYGWEDTTEQKDEVIS